MAGKGGGAWKVAYADFVTAMMAFFLVMWITAQSNAIKKSVARYFEHPFDAASRSPVPADGKTGASMIPLHRDMDGNPPHSTSKGKAAYGGGLPPDHQPAADQAHLPKSGGLRSRSGFMLREDDPSGMGNVITFADDSIALDDRAKQALDEMIPLFNGKRNKIEIRGTTMEQATQPDSLQTERSSSRDAWLASYKRCQAVMGYLEQHGIEANRFRLSQSCAVEPPLASRDADAENLAPRIEVYMLSEYADDFFQHSVQTDPNKQATPNEPSVLPDSSGTPVEAKPSASSPVQSSI